MKIDFSGQVVLVTGATRGIGQQIAEEFAAAGAELLLTGTDKTQIEALNKHAAQDRRVTKKYYAVDFTDSESVERFITKINKLEQIDVCVNNAGINRINPIEKTLVEDWDDMLAVNLKAPFLLVREVAGKMIRNNYGRIINISSIFGVVSKAERSIYSATKFGLHGLTVAISLELARHNILVNTVSPGFVLTDLTRKNLSEAEQKGLATQIPMGRFAEPAEISSVVFYLASKANSYLTGQNIIVDGGFVNV